MQEQRKKLQEVREETERTICDFQQLVEPSVIMNKEQEISETQIIHDNVLMQSDDNNRSEAISVSTINMMNIEAANAAALVVNESLDDSLNLVRDIFLLVV